MRAVPMITQDTPIVLMLKSFAPCRHSPRQLMLIVYSTLKRSCAVACGGDISSPTDFDVVGGARGMGKRACLHAAHWWIAAPCAHGRHATALQAHTHCLINTCRVLTTLAVSLARSACMPSDSTKDACKLCNTTGMKTESSKIQASSRHQKAFRA
jgi:hypothetical protein